MKIATLTNIILIYNNPKSETVFQIFEIFKCLSSVLKTHLLIIFKGKFNLYNLYKLRALYADEEFNT